MLWQAMGLGWGVAAIGTLAALGADPEGPGVAGGALTVLDHAVRDVTGEIRPPGLTAAMRLLCLGASAALLALLCWVLIASAGAVLRDRRRHRALLSLLAHGDPKVPGALVVDYPAAAAYCVPGLRSRIVISAGALDLLDQAELAAVLAHERAHLRERHDLVLLPFTALARAFPWSVLVQRSYASVALLVEMLADDHAARQRPARELVTALIRVGAAGTPGTPAGTLAVADEDGSGSRAEGESGVTARVERLLTPSAGTRPGRPDPGLQHGRRAGRGPRRAPGDAALAAASSARRTRPDQVRTARGRRPGSAPGGTLCPCSRS